MEFNIRIPFSQFCLPVLRKLGQNLEGPRRTAQTPANIAFRLSCPQSDQKLL